MTDLRSTGSNDFERLLEFLRGSDQARLPPERELAETLGMTRNRLRTGLRKLAAEGAIWRHVGKGTYLGAKPSARQDRQLQVAETTNPREIMEARIAVEPELARLAAYNATGHDFTDMRRRVEAMRGATQWEVWEQLDVEFHRTIASATSFSAQCST